ncbi:MAG: FMN-binding protein [Prevotella sp.]|nr:FMN-binding protein [Prevotella sp.]
MNKKTIITSSVAAIAVAVFLSAMPADSVITKDAGTTIVNTTNLTKNVRGYRGATPVKIFIKKNRVTKVEALQNHETPQYFAKAKALLDNFEGKTVTKAEKMDVDAVSGATMSSKALIKNVRTGLQYYKDHK